MLGISKIISKKKNTMLPIRNIVINVNYVNGITLSLSKMEISIYYVMDVSGSSYS